MALLTGSLIATALGRTRRPIELRDIQGIRIKAEIGVGEIQAYLAADYELHGTKRRARYFCPPRPKLRKELPFQKCWLNSEAAVLWEFQNESA